MSRRNGWWNQPRPAPLGAPPPAGGAPAAAQLLQLVLDPAAAALLIGALALALKHPEMPRHAGEAAKRILDSVIDWALAVPAWDWPAEPSPAVRAEWIHYRRATKLPLLTLTEVAVCVRCGCTQAQACQTPDGPCSWVELGPSPDHALCSACASKVAL